ncbi:MAG: transcription antitermination factor NusB [Christensenellaceae bacterium]|nr:transcription antitermination factor NusB [Christensenellaceae bacterium]MBR3843703.1 transcription antitermination factor NusB [Christensenellaceae bacterium]
MSRRLAREAVMCLLYEREIQGEKIEGTLQEMEDVLHTSRIIDKQGEYIDSVMGAFDAHQEETDAMIEKYSRDWSFDRISKVDLSILRLSVIELVYLRDIPVRVSVNEAVELAKKYSDDKSPSFINGILASVIAECREEEAE